MSEWTCGHLTVFLLLFSKSSNVIDRKPCLFVFAIAVFVQNFVFIYGRVAINENTFPAYLLGGDLRLFGRNPYENSVKVIVRRCFQGLLLSIDHFLVVL